MSLFTSTDVPPKRTFLILLSLFLLVGGGVAVIARQFTSDTEASSSLVKDDVVTTTAVATEEVGGTVEAFAEQSDKPLITTYTVKKGDTLSSIASSFSISTSTILWANDLTKKSTIKEGQKLTILPVSGVVYSVAKGDSLGKIAEKFDVSIHEIVTFNDLEDTKTIKLGMKLIIPNGELPMEKTPVEAKPAVKPLAKKAEVVVEKKAAPTPALVALATSTVATDVDVTAKTVVEDEPVSKGYFTHPIPGSVLTQGAHGYNSVDFGAPVGTSVHAAAAGTVIVAKPEGYNGGYGKYIVIEHDNGTQTLYAHLSSVKVSVDDVVTKNQLIGLSGNTGRSTGPHLHFEVRGGTNPWVGVKKMTKF